MVRIIVIIISLIAICSCTTTKFVPIESIKENCDYKTDLFYRTDSIRDSVIIDRYSRGDTVFITKYKQKDNVRFVCRVLSDTIIQRDTIKITLQGNDIEASNNIYLIALLIICAVVILYLITR